MKRNASPANIDAFFFGRSFDKIYLIKRNASLTKIDYFNFLIEEINLLLS